MFSSSQYTSYHQPDSDAGALFDSVFGSVLGEIFHQAVEQADEKKGLAGVTVVDRTNGRGVCERRSSLSPFFM